MTRNLETMKEKKDIYDHINFFLIVFISQYLLGIDSRTLSDTKFQRCLSFLYKLVWYLHIGLP